MSITHYLQTPVGCISFVFEDDILVKMAYLYEAKKKSTRKPSKVQSGFFKKISQYFKQPQNFDVPLHSGMGTPFQLRVWQALLEIPLGETRTYGELAKKLKSSARAVGMGCRTNPLPLIIPCHRIVSATGIGGFCGKLDGKPISVKEWLLTHEARLH
jgi:methylated-DNA-[protein]-cysteine S-methyltransferase